MARSCFAVLLFVVVALVIHTPSLEAGRAMRAEKKDDILLMDNSSSVQLLGLPKDRIMASISEKLPNENDYAAITTNQKRESLNNFEDGVSFSFSVPSPGVGN